MEMPSDPVAEAVMSMAIYYFNPRQEPQDYIINDSVANIS